MMKGKIKGRWSISDNFTNSKFCLLWELNQITVVTGSGFNGFQLEIGDTDLTWSGDEFEARGKLAVSEDAIRSSIQKFWV